MPTTCLICCQQANYFLLPPCNHKQMCWKCCTTLIQGSTFSCPYCKGTHEGTSCILFVNEQQMKQFTFQQILKRNPYKSAAKSYQFYSNQQVANFIEESTTIRCKLCNQSFDNINIMKKHLNQQHKKQFCDVCLQNRKCLISQQKLYSEGQLHIHKKKGQYSHEGENILYHPQCYFCKTRFYDLDSFKAHLRISTHLRCHICQKNYPKFKYVYYKDYLQIQKHFQKSHFVCQYGNCITKKLENVYVSQQMLEQHRMRVHNNKNSGKANRPVTNLLLFKQQQQQLQWDKIGRDFKKQFMIEQKQQVLKNQEHYDTIIDIRQFYTEQIMQGNRMSIQQITQRLGQFMYRIDNKSQQIKFTSVPLFCPLNMSSLMRVQLQKFIRSIYDPKYSEPLIEIFFTRKFQYRSQNDFFQDIRRRMWSCSPISYYYCFPQLIRFYKNTNPTKRAMDQFYSQSLRSLQITNLYIFHKKQRYSDILNILHEHIQSYLYQLMIQQKIDLNLYKTYLKDLNPNFYQANHQVIFYVQREKIKNMYHMVRKTRVNEILKFNWLLMLGLSKNSLKIIFDKFYYKPITWTTKDYDINQWVTYMTYQQLALLYAYIQICRQSFIKQLFQVNKQASNPLFLGNVLPRLKTCISTKQLSQLRQIQIKAMDLVTKLNSEFQIQSKNKKKIVNEEDCPSLLQQTENEKNSKTNTPAQINSLGLPWQNVNITNKNNIRVNKKSNMNAKEQQQQEFPQLLTNETKNKNKETKTKNKRQEDQQQQFPIFNYKQKSSNQKQMVNKKKKIKQQQPSKNNVQRYDLFNKKNAFPSQKITQQYYQNKSNNKSQANQQKQENWPSLHEKDTKKQVTWDPSDWPTMNQSIQQNNQKVNNKEKNKQKQKQKEKEKILQQEEQNFQMSRKNKRKKKKLQQAQQTIPQDSVNKEQQIIPQELIVRKKTKQQLKAQQEAASKKQKGKNNQGNSQIKSMDGEEKKNEINQNQKDKVQKQLIPVSFSKKQKSRRIRLDMTDSQQQEKQRNQRKKKQKEQKHKKFLQQEKLKQSIRYNEGFESLQQLDKMNKQTNKAQVKDDNQNKNSIINMLIEQSKKNNQVKAPEIIVKKGKKGKAVIIERVDLSKL